MDTSPLKFNQNQTKMNDYQKFLETKIKTHITSGFDVDESDLNKNLFDFQKLIVTKAIKKGRYAVFADTGLGKTLMQLSWAYAVAKKTNQRVLILAPLSVKPQTVKEAAKFKVDLSLIDINNYEQLDNIDTSIYSGVVLDESSILKNVNGKRSQQIIDAFISTPYKLACSATPSPNDHMELGVHAEFLGACTYLEMLAQYFVHDGGETSKWRLRKHAEKDFWNFVLSWSIAIDNPATFGFDGKKYKLPELNFFEHVIEFDSNDGDLFGEAVVSATELHRELRKTLHLRCNKALEIIGDSKEPFILWGLQNAETDLLKKIIPNSINVSGSDKPEVKAKNLIGFADGEFQNLITKTKIASFGMNYQHCHNMIFVSYDFSFESFYQAVRRSYRFGQTKEVNVHILVPKTQTNVRKTILMKEQNHKEMIHNLAKKSYEFEEFTKPNNLREDVKTEDYHLMNGDCVQRIKEVPDNSVGLSVFSPPFAELYVYSDKIEDMGNVSNYKMFEEQFKYLIPELKRVLKPGRIVAIHCMDLPIQKGKEGFIGLRDFSGMLVDWFTDEGFIYHARTTIWKNPVTEMQRTKSIGLLHKTIKKDSSMSRVGIPDYVLFFRNEGVNEEPITHQDTDPNKPDYLPVDLWQKYASPVWMDINYSRTLQYTTARDSNDEKHICPLQLDTIERILHLYSNEGDTVLSPFGGIGSEGFSAVKNGRKSISIELKESYFDVNVQNHNNAVLENGVLKLF